MNNCFMIILVIFLSVQRPLTHQAKAEIYKELKTVAIVTEVQYTIRTVLSFIRRNLNPKQKIVQFMNELKMTEPLRCAKVRICYESVKIIMSSVKCPSVST